MFELKLGNGKVVTWQGKDGKDAARRYTGSHPEVTVIAWRYILPELHIGMIQILD